MFNLFARLFPTPPAERPTPVVTAIPSPPTPVAEPSLAPLKNWSNPFKDARPPLDQLTHLARATGGFYPLGVNGLWHGGIHFDAGTAGVLDQSSVHCLADGEVVAYRIDTRSPTTAYRFNKMTVYKPFSRNFVLIRHRLQAPMIAGENGPPPSLTFYSLYMHLQDVAAYEADPQIPRPPFWPEGGTYSVRDDVNDLHIDHPGQKGLNVRHAPKGKIIGWLPRGTEVKVSGEGTWRRLEDSLGPKHLLAADGTLRGYVAAEFLKVIDNGQHRVHCKTTLKVRAQPVVKAGNEITHLLPGTEVTVSGEGAFRKLERVNQYLHFPSLQGSPEPQARDQIVVLEQPIAIKPGDLIGHVGLYQEGKAEHPERKLHLEVFSADDLPAFLSASRGWAKKLPASSKTWLKLAKGTSVIAHQAQFSAKNPPSLQNEKTLSAAGLLIPKTFLDRLPAERKITQTAQEGRKACTWYRLENLLHDTDNRLLDGWIRDETGITPWFSPWAWEGYDHLVNHNPPEHQLASFMRATGRFDDTQHARHGGMADSVDTGPLKTRLYDLIDHNRDGQLSATELQTALHLPAHAQSISQLVIHTESEWLHTPGKWDALDELLGHSGSTPHVNWLAEKERMREASWWAEVAEGVGLPGDARVHHLHPVGLLGHFSKASDLINVDKFLKLYETAHADFASGTRALTLLSRQNLEKILIAINNYYRQAPASPNIYEVSYMLATVRHETYHFLTGEFFSEKPEIGDRAYFNKYDPVLADNPKHRLRAALNGNTAEGDGFKYRGRGCVHLTWKNNYQKFSNLLNHNFVADPDKAALIEYSVPIMIMGMARGDFTGRKLSDFFGNKNKDYEGARSIINGHDKGALIASYAERFETILRQASDLGV